MSTIVTSLQTSLQQQQQQPDNPNSNTTSNTTNNKTKILLLESPTGSGKTLTLITSVMTYMDASRDKALIRLHDKANKEKENDEKQTDDWLGGTSSANGGSSDDWMSGGGGAGAEEEPSWLSGSPAAPSSCSPQDPFDSLTSQDLISTYSKASRHLSHLSDSFRRVLDSVATEADRQGSRESLK